MTIYPDGYSAPQHKPHCGVLSVAICAGVTFETAWETIAAVRKPTRKAWTGGNQLPNNAYTVQQNSHDNGGNRAVSGTVTVQ